MCWRPYRARRVGARSRAYVPVDPVEVVAVAGHAADQGAILTTHSDGVSRVAQALLGQAVLGARIFLDDLGKCDRRYHHAVPGITFQTGC